jgi:adenosylhomocysteine nucleosidase
MQTLVIAPLKKEFDHLVDALRNSDLAVDLMDIGAIECARVPKLELTLGVGGHGKAQFAAGTQHLLCHLPNVDLVVCAGAAGTLSDQLVVGDVVAGTHTIEHDYRERFSDHPPPHHPGHSSRLEDFQAVAMTSAFPFGVHFGPIASGDEDIVDEERAYALHAETAALCVAWEGSGGARAAALSETPFLEIRTITDSADKTAPMDFQGNLAVAIPNIATLLVACLSRCRDVTDG